jgi:hypothetical protein
MNSDFLKIIAAKPEERRELFLETSQRIGTAIQNVEKDFWVTWVLDLLFNGRGKDEPHLLFKGGTSLSKAYGLISRFSEDIDITVFRAEIGQDIKVADLEGMSGKKQEKALDNIKAASQAFIQGALKKRLESQMIEAFKEAKVTLNQAPVVIDPSDPQTLLIGYPACDPEPSAYVPQTVKIEAGAKSALDPHHMASIEPYVAKDFKGGNLSVPNVATIDAERTFWDKVLILHGLRRWHDSRGILRQQGQRVSRHYYDLHQLMRSPIGPRAIPDQALATDCARHALVFFNMKDLDLKSANKGTYALLPSTAMMSLLKQDYQAMTGMIFGGAPRFEEVIESVKQLEFEINKI